MNVFRAVLARDFWITGIAIARHIPWAFRVKQVDGNQFFTEEKRQEYRRRVESVTPKAGSKEAFRQVDYVLPLAFAKLAHQQGAETFALVSAIGSDANSSFF